MCVMEDKVCKQICQGLDKNRKHSILELLKDGKKITAIKELMRIAGFTLKEAKLSIDSEWIWDAMANTSSELTLEEFKSKILQVFIDMSDIINDSEMSKDDKISFLIRDEIPRVLDLCMEE